MVKLWRRSTAPPQDGPAVAAREALRADLSREYYALLDVVSAYDGRLIVVKGWSVTLSLAALGVGFQFEHYALFALGAATALGFWYLDALLKGHQMRSYSRMRDIELAAYELNRVELPGLGLVSAPRIDTTWGFTGRAQDADRRDRPPRRRTAASVRRMLRGRYVMPHVLLPHLVGVVLGSTLFLAALGDHWGLDALRP